MKDASAMLEGLAQKQIVAGPKRWSAWFVISAGAILALAGANHLLDFFDKSQVWDLRDPLLGILFRYSLPLVGLFQLFVAWLCLFTHRRTLSMGLLAWLYANFIVYRVGLWAMGWSHPWVFVGGLTDTLNISPLLADGLISATGLYLLVGSSIALWLAHQAANSDGFRKMSCPACGGHVQFVVQNMGQKIPCPHCQKTSSLRKPENLKMSCFFCLGHIEFPSHALGQKMPCPHCKEDITLKEPI